MTLSVTGLVTMRILPLTQCCWSLHSFCIIFWFCHATALPQLLVVNGQTEGSQQKAEDLPFIVVAATENDSTNEPFIIPTDDSKPNQPGFNLLPSGFFEEDLEVVAADDSEVSNGFIPTNNAESGKPGFNLLTPEDLAREEESEALVAVRIKKDSISDEYDDVVVIEAGDNDDEPRNLDIPRDLSGKDNPGFKLPLPNEDYEDEYDDVVIIEAGFDNDDKPRTLDIPRDHSGKDNPGFKLPLPDEEYEDEYDDVVIIEAGDNDDESRTLDIPRDHSGKDNAGFKLPLPDEEYEDEYDDVVIIEAGDNDEEPRNLDIPRDHSGKDNPGFKLPLPDEEYEDEYADVVVISREEEGGRNLDQNSREPKRIDTKPILPNCFAEKDPGSCLNSHKAWHYDATQNQCQFFIYSGCGGNTNRFFTEEDCLSQCKDAQRTLSSSKGADKTNNCDSSAPICEKGCTLTKDNEGACLKCNCKKEQDVVERCLQPSRRGLCKALLKYWYYNADRQACEEFTYGGCEAGSSPNKFRTKALCEATCGGVTRHLGA